MSTLSKMVVPCIGCFVSGGGLVGSNYVFKKEALVSIRENEDNEWTNKVSKLLEKVRVDSQLSAKIDKNNHSTNLKIVVRDSIRVFEDNNKAKTSLKAWCSTPNKESNLKDTENELCKNKQKVGWLFGS